MSVSTRTLAQESEIIQDNMPIDNTLDGPGDPLSVTLGGSNKTMAKIYRWCIGLSKTLGENSRRKGATRFNGANIALTGLITSSGIAVTGSSTLFLTELSVGDFIAGPSGEFREVQSIASNTSLTLVDAFSADIVVASAFVRMQYLAERLDALSAVSGLIIGGLVFNSTTTPPRLKAGAYEVLGAIKKFTSNLALTLAGNAFKKSLQALDTYAWYNIVLDTGGNARYVLATGDQISGATGNTASITNPAGNTKRLTISTGSIAGVAVGHIIIVKNSTNNDGVFKITATDASTYMEFETNDTLTDVATGTYEVRTRITTLHGTGTATNINANADIEKYTPSNVFNSALNGFYLDQFGINTNVAASHRIIGVFYSDSVPNVTYFYSYLSGDNKNDNVYQLYNILSYIGGQAFRFANIDYLHGNDYTYIDDGVNGAYHIINSPVDALSNFQNYDSALAVPNALTKLLTNALIASNLDTVYTASPANAVNTVHADWKLLPGQYVKPLTQSTATADDQQRWYGVYRKQ